MKNKTRWGVTAIQLLNSCTNSHATWLHFRWRLEQILHISVWKALTDLIIGCLTQGIYSHVWIPRNYLNCTHRLHPKSRYLALQKDLPSLLLSMPWWDFWALSTNSYFGWEDFCFVLFEMFNFATSSNPNLFLFNCSLKENSSPHKKRSLVESHQPASRDS